MKSRAEIAALPTICDGPSSIFAIRRRRNDKPRTRRHGPSWMLCRQCNDVREHEIAGPKRVTWRCLDCGHCRRKQVYVGAK